MATIIRSISFQNFYNYFGNYNEDTTYQFVEGINIINADNNMGKSKFYNGILWILNDKVYDSDTKEMKLASTSFEKMASGKAKKEHQDFDMGVKIRFDENDVSYEVEKKVNFVWNNGIWDTNPRTIVHETIGSNDHVVYDKTEQEEIINKLVPSGLKNYALLQGETMERLVDLSSTSGLYSTINALADVKLLNEVCDSGPIIYKSAKKLANEKAKIASAKNSDKRKLLEEKETLSMNIENNLEKIKQYQKELQKAKATKEQTEALAVSSSERVQYKNDMDAADKIIADRQKEKNRLEAAITARIFDERCPWLLMKLGKNADTFDENRTKWLTDLAKRSERLNLINLPPGSPDTGSLARMLKNCHCEVCDRDFEKGSVSYNHIEYLRTRPHPEEQAAKNNLNIFFGDISKHVTAIAAKVDNIPAEISEYRSRLARIEEEINLASKDKEIAMAHYIDVGGGDANIGTDKSNLSKLSLANNTIEKMNNLIKNAQTWIDRWKERFVQVEAELKQYGVDEAIDKYSRFEASMELIKTVFQETKDRIFDELIAILEDNANEKYDSLTKGNATRGGKICFKKCDDDTIQVTIRDIENGELTGLGTGFQRMKQLAIVMAIIESKIGNKYFDYPFISDAPFSEFGDQFIRNFFDVAPGVFSQSIILIKDLYDPNPVSDSHLKPIGKNILERMQSGEIKGAFYVNEIIERADTSNLVTSHKRYF